ncbi:MAG TPA: DUF5522 domain-containing protein [Chitinophagaceae bacterium]|nr:DUF5522 domain-containing protein [Chitinophagaceae bacterium]
MKFQYRDEESYHNPDGLVVFNEAYLLSRGYCCGNGCRHCPYNYKMVSDPVRREKLQIARRNRMEDENKNSNN